MMVQEYHCTFHEGRHVKCEQVLSCVPSRGDWVLINNVMYQIERVTFDMRVSNGNAIAVSLLLERTSY